MPPGTAHGLSSGRRGVSEIALTTTVGRPAAPSSSLADQPLALAAGEQVVHGDDLAGVGPQPGPAQLGGQQRRGRAGDRGGRPDPADLSSDHEVTRLLISGDSPAGTGNRHGLERDAA
jgi:hypothetical protein